MTLFPSPYTVQLSLPLAAIFPVVVSIINIIQQQTPPVDACFTPIRTEERVSWWVVVVIVGNAGELPALTPICTTSLERLDCQFSRISN